MVIFDRLEISPEGDKLMIEAHVNEAEMFTGYTITDLYIKSDKNFLESEVDILGAYHESFDNVRSINVVIPNTSLLDIELTKNLIFAYIKVKPVANGHEACIPCGLDDNYSIGVTFDTQRLYSAGIKYIKDLGDTCSIHKNFIDFILYWEAFKMAIDTDHYIDAVHLYKRMFSMPITSEPKCNCHG